ncbi:MAG: NADH-quinone oxidoreductase subunit J [Planctomycetes bacterium]|jgi:NADH-quinone oxidoreductase subunit J|nr:NADH-quinone oxidoreductase subunit J [Planctomycetota bacterium]
MDYPLIIATAFGAIALYLMMPRGEAWLFKLGMLIGVLALGTGLSYLTHWATLHFPNHPGIGPGVFFYVFSLLAIGSAVGVVGHSKPIYSALYFVLMTLAISGLFVLLLAEFMAVVLIIIYAGAILVTYVFVIMLASPSGVAAAAVDYDRVSADPLIAILVSFLLLGTILEVLFSSSAPGTAAAVVGGAVTTAHGAHWNGLAALGQNLYSRYTIPLELAGVLMTISLVGAVVIARKNAPRTHTLGSGDMPTE